MCAVVSNFIFVRIILQPTIVLLRMHRNLLDKSLVSISYKNVTTFPLQICESSGGFYRLIASFHDDVRTELIPNGFVWHIYAQTFSGEESKQKAVISFYCDELMKNHKFELSQLPGPSEVRDGFFSINSAFLD